MGLLLLITEASKLKLFSENEKALYRKNHEISRNKGQFNCLESDKPAAYPKS